MVMMSLAGHSTSSDSEVWLFVAGGLSGRAGAAPQEPVVDTWTWMLRHLLFACCYNSLLLASFNSFISTSLISLAGFVSSGGNTNWRVLVILEPTPDITVHYETRFARSYLIASCRLSFYTLSGCRYFRCSCAITPTRFDIFFPFAKHQHALPTALVPARVGGPGDCPGGQCL